MKLKVISLNMIGSCQYKVPAQQGQLYCCQLGHLSVSTS